MFTPFHLILWVVSLAALGFAGAPYGRALFPGGPDGCVGAGRVIALTLWMFLFWIVPVLTGLSPTPVWAVLSLGAVVAGALWIRKREAGSGFYNPWVWTEMGLFIGLSLLFLWIRSYSADLSGNEKYGDFMILHSLAISDKFPPQDRWFAGAPLSYYYLGHLLFVPLAKIVAAPTEHVFNLAVASLLPLTSGVLFTLFGREFRRLRAAAIFVVTAIFLGTLATLGQFIFGDGPFSWFRTSRVIDGTITEYPIFSFFVGDLHGHFISFPVTLIAAAVIWVWISSFERRPWLYPLAAGALVGLHSGLHPWTVPPLLLLTAAGWVCRYTGPREARPEWRSSGISILLFIAAMAVIALPYSLRNVRPPLRIEWVSRELQAGVLPFFQQWGAFLLPLGWLTVTGARTKSRLIWIAVAAAGVGLIAGQSWVKAMLMFVLLGIATGKFKTKGEGQNGRLFAVSGLALLLLCELVYFSEGFAAARLLSVRQNTVFKFGYVAWGFFLLAIPWIWTQLSSKGRWAAAGVASLTFLFIPMTLATRGTTGIASLDGLLWMKVLQPDDAACVQWLRANAAPGERLVESVGPRYQGYSPLSSFSGRPALLGWSEHEEQWRTGSGAEIVQRSNEIREIYSTDDVRRLSELLGKYDIRYVAVGPREKKMYPNASFAAVKKLPVAFEGRELTLYSVDASAAVPRDNPLPK